MTSAPNLQPLSWPELHWQSVPVEDQMEIIYRIMSGCPRPRMVCLFTSDKVELEFMNHHGTRTDESLTVDRGRREGFRAYYFTGTGRNFTLGTMHRRSSASPLVCFHLVATITMSKVIDGQRCNITIADFLGLSLDYERHFAANRNNP